MRSFVKTCLTLAMFSALIPATAGRVVRAQQTSAAPPSMPASTNLSQARIDEIIRAFTVKETGFRQALNDYAFKRDALVQTIGMGGQVTGEYHRVSLFTFDDKGNRFERINFFPMPSLTEITITAQDLEDLGGVNPFALEASKLNAYTFKYVGKERIDELDLYVFDVGPKTAPDPKKVIERFFQGRIWVDQQDLQIVKARGKGVPEDKNNKYATFETYREQIDGKYWFPTYTYADDELVFDSGQSVRVRMRVKYTDFVVGRGKVTITEIEEATPENLKPRIDKPESRPSPSPTSPTSQPTSSASETAVPMEGGVLNSKALELPAPKSPATGSSVRVAGQVQVRVLVDETGKVISAEALFGPESLRQAAVDAAKHARFAPTVVEGITVKVSGIITYDFKAQ